MQLNLDQLGRITKEYPKTFYRVSYWSNDIRIADFTNEDEAKMFSITDARENCCNYDHKVSTMHIG